MNRIDKLYTAIKNAIDEIFGDNKRAIKEVDSWDGSASNYEDTNAYCSACLIDVNPSGEDKVQGLCMLPVRGPGDSADTYVDKAVMAAAGGHGITQVKKPDGVEQDTWDSALKGAANKIISAYNEMDKQAPDAVYELAGKMPPESSRSIQAGAMMEQVWDQMYQMSIDTGEYRDFWLNDLYFDQDGSPFVIISSGGKLYRAQVSIAEDTVTMGELQEVVIDFKAHSSAVSGEEDEPGDMTEDEPIRVRTKVTVRRQKDGAYRWFGISCSSVLNRMGIFDTRALFDSFEAYFNSHPEEKVYRMFYHQGDEFKTGVVDYVTRDGNLLLTSGVYDNSPLAEAEIKAREKDPEYWGDSIGFWSPNPETVSVGDGIEIPAYVRGILREVSTLPEAEAASHFTAQVVAEEVRAMLEGKALEAFIKLWGGDEAAAMRWLEENPDRVNRMIQDQGLQTRSAEGENTEGENTSDQVAEMEAERIVTISEDELRMLSDTVLQSEGIVELTSRVASVGDAVNGVSEAVETLTNLIHELAGRLDKLEADDEEKRQQWIEDLPRQSRIVVTDSPRLRAKASDEKQGAVNISEDIAQNALQAIPPYPRM